MVVLALDVKSSHIPNKVMLVFSEDPCNTTSGDFDATDTLEFESEYSISSRRLAGGVIRGTDSRSLC